MVDHHRRLVHDAMHVRVHEHSCLVPPLCVAHAHEHSCRVPPLCVAYAHEYAHVHAVPLRLPGWPAAWMPAMPVWPVMPLRAVGRPGI